MAMRTTKSLVTFQSPFLLKGFVKPEPPGTYQVETDEEIIEGNGHTAYRRIATLLYVVTGSTTRTVRVEPSDLEAALRRDRS